MGRMVSIPPFALFPLVAAFVYSLGALAMKRSSVLGVGPWRTAFFSNLSMGLLFAPMFWFESPAVDWGLLWQPALAALVFFAGQVATFLSIDKGDVSVATPVLGSKVVFVAILSVLFFGDPVSLGVWGGAGLTTFAIFLLRGFEPADRQRLLPSIGYGLAAAAAYAMFDVLFSQWSKAFGFNRFVPITFALVAASSLLMLPLFKGRKLQVPRRAAPWLGLGCALLTGQALVLAYGLSNFRQATAINILYSTRGLWSIVLVWTIGSWFGNTERHAGGKALGMRLAGAVLMLAAVLIVFVE